MHKQRKHRLNPYPTRYARSLVGLRPAAFTLIELLVVIAIIALLMSILMPALERVKKQTQVVLCQSNLHQLGIVFKMFTQDNDNKFMSGYEYEDLMTGPSGFSGDGPLDR